MLRNGILIWLCAGALGAGVLAVVASRRNAQFKKGWFFLAFVLPTWLDNWRKTKGSDK